MAPPDAPVEAANEDIPDPLAARDFDKLFQSTLEDFPTPGMAVAVVNKDKTFSKGYGHANLSSKEAITPKTLFFAASTTKSFTAAAVSKLISSDSPEHKHITWNTRLVDLIRDDFVLQDKYMQEHITITDALSHRTGMPRHDMIGWNQEVSVKEQVRHLRHVPLHHELREAFEYCNLIYAVVSYAILHSMGKSVGTIREGVKGMQELFEKWFWKPLAMHSTFYDLKDALDHVEKTPDVNIARGHQYDEDKHQFIQTEWSDIPPASGAGGIISSVLDYTHWIRAFLRPENANDAITSETITAMTTPHMPTDFPLFPPMHGTGAYGLGLTMGTYHGVRVVCHKGAIAGYMSVMLWIPERDWGVVIMQNSYSLAYEVILWRLIDDFLGLSGSERFDAAEKARDLQKEKKEKMQTENVRERLWPGAPDRATVAPALDLTAYEGTYRHAAYGDLKLSLSPKHAPSESSTELSAPKETVSKSVPDASRILYTGPSRYLQVRFNFHHVNGEYWYAHLQSGPGDWLLDDMAKVKFEVGVDGKVTGLRLQAESAIEDLALFERVK